MKRFTVAQVAEVCGGQYAGPSGGDRAEVCGVVIDNRKVRQGSLFVPIKGERFDGHDFIESAYEAGAVCCISEKQLGVDRPHVVVESSLQAFQDIAGFYRSLFDVAAIGITGSVGKTTTKEMMAGVLEQELCVLKSEGNLNNQTGVPQTVLRLCECHQVAIVEMGTNHFGEIRSLAKMVRPELCFLTNIGMAHMEHLGSKQGILQAKCEMLEYMQQGGTVYINGDDPNLWQLKEQRDDVIAFGRLDRNDICARDIVEKGLMGTNFTVCFGEQQAEVHVPAPGEHMVSNALAAFAAGLAFDMEIKNIVAGIAAYRPIAGRMCMEQAGDVLILNDVYNANPGSVKAALDVLAYGDGRKVCVLGDMLELGENARGYHREVGRHAGEQADLVLCVGDLAKNIYAGAIQSGGVARWFSTQEELLGEIAGLIQAGDTVLVKASRGMALEKTVERLHSMATS